MKYGKYIYNPTNGIIYEIFEDVSNVEQLTLIAKTDYEYVRKGFTINYTRASVMRAINSGIWKCSDNLSNIKLLFGK